MVEIVKSTVRMVKKGQEDGIEIEVPLNLTKEQKIKRVKDIYRDNVGKRPYNCTYEITN